MSRERLIAAFAIATMVLFAAGESAAVDSCTTTNGTVQIDLVDISDAPCALGSLASGCDRRGR